MRVFAFFIRLGIALCAIIVIAGALFSIEDKGVFVPALLFGVVTGILSVVIGWVVSVLFP